MKPGPVSLLCRPGTHEPLQLSSIPATDGSAQEVLVGVHSGEKFLVKDGIPLLLDESRVSGFNKRYQEIYNRVAGVYDMAIRLVGRLAGAGTDTSKNERSTRTRLRKRISVPPDIQKALRYPR